MKILCLGDSPHINTGFGVVNRIACEALQSLGHDLVILGAQDFDRTESEYGTYIAPTKNKTDVMGWFDIPSVFEKHPNIEAVHIIGDPTMVTLWTVQPEIESRPIVAYMPVEGAPLNMRWTERWKTVPNLRFITCSQYGADVLSQAGFGGLMAYHGVSHDFYQYDAERREAMRYAMGWDNKFIVMCVAQNVGRKNWPILFEAMARIKKYTKSGNVYLYAHTIPFNNNWLGGHDLPQLAQQMGVQDRVIFNDDLLVHNDSVPLHGGERPGLVDFYNMADAFVLPSKVEGFGLPLAEAMACGLPVATTDYAAQAEVVGDAGIKVPVHSWEWNQSHAKYGNVNPAGLAEAILKMGIPEVNKRMRVKSLARAKAFTWDAYRTALKEEFGVAEEQADNTPAEEQVDL